VYCLKGAEKVMAATELLVFKPSPIHGIGAFARCEIAAGSRIIEYVGERIDKRESVRRCERNNQCIFGLNAEVDIDGSVEWNLARFINHSCTPNCEADLVDGRIWFLAKRSIGAGEEVVFNYGYDLEDYRRYPCNCGSPHCVGYIVAEEFFQFIPEWRRPGVA
jgi:uncharacterized protein